MGLDISAYNKLKVVDCVFDRDGDPINPKTRKPLAGNWWQPTRNEHFTDRAKDINFDKVYLYKSAIGVHAGSYGGYSQWREQLAKMAGWPAVEIDRYGTIVLSHQAATWEANNGDFFELLLFSDCEGTLGTGTCKKLAEDFAKFQPKADAEGGWFLKKYNEWRKAFDHASDNGAISFH